MTAPIIMGERIASQELLETVQYLNEAVLRNSNERGAVLRCARLRLDRLEEEMIDA